MTYEVTESGIKYDWWIDGPQAGKFKLFPVKGVHSQDDIKNSKAELKRDFDVVYIELEWVTKEQNEQLTMWKGSLGNGNVEQTIEL